MLGCMASRPQLEADLKGKVWTLSQFQRFGLTWGLQKGAQLPLPHLAREYKLSFSVSQY